MGEIFGAAGQIAGAAINASAIENATRQQVEALQRQRDFVFANLNPDLVSAQSTQADIRNAMARLALQGQIDPALLRTRYAAESQIEQRLGELGAQAGQVSDQAVQEALAARGPAEATKNAMIDAALEQLRLGATLPADVQSELAQAGLEQGGQSTGAAGGRGVGGQLLRTILGQAGIKLQQQRQQQAAALMDSASNLETKRQNILQQLFPNLSSVQLANLGGATSALSTAEALRPAAGPTGTDITNLMLARVGSTNQIAQSQADVAARGAIGASQAWGNALGGGIGALGRALPLSTVRGWVGGGGSPSSQFDWSNPGNY